MDGWALRSGATPGILRVVAESAAGRPYRGVLGPDEAVRISTGAVLPDAADAVLRREHGSENGGVLVAPHVAAGRDLRVAGDEYPLAADVLPDGHRVRAHDLGVIATCGWDGAFCERRPRVAIVATGDELVPPGQLPEDAAVVDSNRVTIAAAAAAAGGEVVWTRCVVDTPDAVRAAVKDAASGGPDAVDLLVTIGGASIGDHDHVRSVLDSISADVVFDGIAMRPGRPTCLAVLGSTRVLVLPGPPGAAVVAFHLIGRELIGGGTWSPNRVAVPCPPSGAYDEFIWCRASDVGLVPVEGQGSSSLSGLARADALAWIPQHRLADAAGGEVLASALP
jgi:molybdopterin molybdotransferase